MMMVPMYDYIKFYRDMLYFYWSFSYWRRFKTTVNVGVRVITFNRKACAMKLIID